jgi:hypothetical protein
MRRNPGLEALLNGPVINGVDHLPHLELLAEGQIGMRHDGEVGYGFYLEGRLFLIHQGISFLFHFLS